MDLYQHFRKEEREFIDRILEWMDQVREQYAPRLSDFLNPREIEIVQMVVGTKGDVRVKFFGGSDQAERKRAFLYPDYYTPALEDFDIKFYQLIYSAKFTKITHREVLGTLMSIGLKREKFGDILMDGSLIQIVVASEVSAYLQANITKMGNAGVKLREIQYDDILKLKEVWQENVVTLSSMRLDTVISAIANISRQKSQQLIQQNRVKVNWKPIDNPSYEINKSDVISVRGIGRMKILSIDGKTKKDKWKILCGLQK